VLVDQCKTGRRDSYHGYVKHWDLPSRRNPARRCTPDTPQLRRMLLQCSKADSAGILHCFVTVMNDNGHIVVHVSALHFKAGDSFMMLQFPLIARG